MSDVKSYHAHSVWIAFYWDFSALAIFDDELEARRHADEGGMEVRNVPFGKDVRTFLSEQRERE